MGYAAFSNEHFADWLEKMVGNPYWYGTTVANCTEDLLKRKTQQYPEHYTADRMARYKKDIAEKKVCADCIGLCKGYAWTNGGLNVLEAIGTGSKITSKYGSNGAPDQSANGMFEYAKKIGMEWGTIGTIPEIRGIAVRFDGHVGYYVGKGYVVEERGFAYGCVKTKLKDRKWTHWYKLPFINYNAKPVEEAKPEEPIITYKNNPYKEPTANIKIGSIGDSVKWVQYEINKRGYDIGSSGIDGDFGKATDAAVKKFQADNGLEADGIVGKMTRTALKNETQEEKPVETAKPIETVTVRYGTWNVRSTPSINNNTIGVASSGEVYEKTGENTEGWVGIMYKGRAAFIAERGII